MKRKPLQHDLFLYEFTVRILGTLATILFSLLFFYGAFASVKTEFDIKDPGKPAYIKSAPAAVNETIEPLGDMH
ncbi:MAG: hypothetical protein V4615_16020 [Bacteroidota bacterium]